MAQTYPVESRKQLHGLIVLTVNKKEISQIEIRKGAIAQLVLALPCHTTLSQNNCTH